VGDRLGISTLIAAGAPQSAPVGRPYAVPRALPARERRVLLTLMLVLTDAVAVALAFALSYAVRFGAHLLPVEPGSGDPSFYVVVGVWGVPLWLALFAAYRLYDQRGLFSGLHEYVALVNASAAAAVGVELINFLHVDPSLSRGWLISTLVLAVVTTAIDRFVVRRVVHALRRRQHLLVPTLIVGVNGEGAALASQILGDSASGARLIGFVDGQLPPGSQVTGALEVLGDLSQINDLIRRYRVGQLIVAATALTRTELLELFWKTSQDPSVDLFLSSGLFEILTTSLQVREIGGVPLVSPQRLRIMGGDALLKGGLDYVAAGVLMLLALPVVPILALAIKLDSPGPLLHRRRVLGVSGQCFDALKFRTMVVDADAVLARDPSLREAYQHGFKLKHDPRVTRVGRFLRRTSLDELPQLFNVLRGEMSLVGPRMITADEAERYGKWQRNLVTVKPGITGPWQIEGRGDLPYDDRVKLSMQYITNYSFWADLAILLRTVQVVLSGKGAY
jgi:exopolysaccharide biosynthesis polyprenyl glycosylphosphotransferase